MPSWDGLVNSGERLINTAKDVFALVDLLYEFPQKDQLPRPTFYSFASICGGSKQRELKRETDPCKLIGAAYNTIVPLALRYATMFGAAVRVVSLVCPKTTPLLQMLVRGLLVCRGADASIQGDTPTTRQIGTAHNRPSSCEEAQKP